MTLRLARRKLLLGAAAGICAPAVVRAQNIIGSGVFGAALAVPSAMSMVIASAPKQYLTTVWSHATTDGTRVTISFWTKFVIAPDANRYYFTTDTDSSTIFDFRYSFAHTQLSDDSSGSYSMSSGTSVTDTSWHHYHIKIDTNQAVASDRVSIYIDGVVLVLNSPTYPALGQNMRVTDDTIRSYIGIVNYQIGGSGVYMDAKFAYFYLIDGQALDPSSFTTGSGAGSIHPVAYTGTYGNNGVFLNGNGSTLNDQSGNVNNWTSVNGVAFDTDVPT